MFTNTLPSLRRRLGVALIAATALTGLLAGCANDAKPASELTISEQWVKAAPTGMTAAFGVLTNKGSKPIHIVAASSPAAGRTEIHEVVPVNGAMKMQQKPGGLVVPAGRSITLKPGGDHIMLFDLPKPITAGQDVTVTLKLEDGSTIDFTAQARDFPGANEKYQH